MPQKRLIILLALVIPMLSMAQNSSLHYEVNRVFPYLSVSKTQLTEANSIGAFNPHFKTSWIRSYESVAVITKQKGQLQKSIGYSDELTPAQKAQLKQADAGTEISVVIRYMPENTLQNNDIQEFDFTFSVNPEREASFVGGPEALNQYLYESAIQYIPSTQFKGFDMAAVKFTVSETGEVLEPTIFQTTQSAEMDRVLLAAIRNMPNWLPAAYADGTSVSQEFALTIGNMENCMVNLLNIRKH